MFPVVKGSRGLVVPLGCSNVLMFLAGGVRGTLTWRVQEASQKLPVMKFGWRGGMTWKGETWCPSMNIPASWSRRLSV